MNYKDIKKDNKTTSQQDNKIIGIIVYYLVPRLTTHSSKLTAFMDAL